MNTETISKRLGFLVGCSSISQSPSTQTATTWNRLQIVVPRPLSRHLAPQASFPDEHALGRQLPVIPLAPVAPRFSAACRRGPSVDTQNRQLADGGRDVDEGDGTVVPRPDEQRLGLREAAADSGPGSFGLDRQPDRGRDRRPPRNGHAVPARGGAVGAGAVAARAKGRQNRPFPGKCPPTHPQNRQFPSRRCPPTLRRVARRRRARVRRTASRSKQP